MRQTKKKKIEKKKNKNFVSCVMVYDVVRFVLRRFLGFLAGFYLFALQLIHFSKIRGLEWLKIRCCVPEHPNKHAQTVLFLHFGRNKRKSG